MLTGPVNLDRVFTLKHFSPGQQDAGQKNRHLLCKINKGAHMVSMADILKQLLTRLQV